MDDVCRDQRGQGDELNRPAMVREEMESDGSEKKVAPPESTHTPDSTSSESDSEDEVSPVEDFSYETSDEWQDIVPVPLTAGSVMPIAFSPSFQSVFGYFRSVQAKGELSPRVLRLCEDAARLNSANYAVWMYRRKVLAHLNSDLHAEVQYVSRVIEKNPKNYQVWYHRQNIVELLKDPSKEFEFTARMLKRDSKNYHVWQYRQFVLRHFDILNHNELDFCDGLIKSDAFNNSAWMHRYFVLDELPRACGRQSLLEGTVLTNEIQYTLNQLSQQIHNESPWSYLRGIVREHWADHFPTIYAFCTDLYGQNFRSPYLLAFMVDMFDEDISHGYQDGSNSDKAARLKQMLLLCSDLASKHDRIRKAYWEWISQQFQRKYAAFLPTEDTA